MKTQTIKHSQSSFTLIELLVVIAIIGILAGMIFVNVSGVIERAKIARSLQFSDSLRNALIMNLVSEWKFDENSGTIAKDFWGGNNGTLVNGPTWKTGGDCVSGSCLQFDGSDDYVNCGGGASLNLTGNFTVELWIKSSSTASLKALWNKNYASSGFYSVNFNYPSAGKVKFNAGSGADSDALDSVKSDLNNGNWRHLVFLVDGTTQKIYIDGVFDNSRTKVSATATDTNFIIGNTSGYSRYFPGLIDEVRIYNAALPTAQIQQHYAEGLKSLLANNAITEQEYAQRISDFNQILVKN